MDKDIVLVGGGGHCRSVIDAVEQLGLRIRGILDLPELLGQQTMGYEVIGNDDDIAKYARECRFVVTLGSIDDPSRRIALHRAIEAAGGELATIVSPLAHVSRTASLGAGTVVLNFANINAGARVGQSCIVNTGANIEHDAEVGDFTHVSTGAIVNGGARVGARVFIGSGAVIRNGITVCDDALIGMGAIVYRNITTTEPILSR